MSDSQRPRPLTFLSMVINQQIAAEVATYRNTSTPTLNNWTQACDQHNVLQCSSYRFNKHVEIQTLDTICTTVSLINHADHN